MAQQSSTALGNPALLTAQPHLQIDRKIIYHNLMMALQDATMLPPYHKYVQQTLQWSSRDLHNVHWNVLKSSLSSFPQDDQH